MRNYFWRAQLALAVFALGVGGCSRMRGAQDEKAARAAFSAYDAAFRAKDIDGMKAHMTDPQSSEAEAMVRARPELIDLALKMRPPNPQIVSCTIAGDSATLQMKGENGGAVMTGEVSLARVDGKWRVAKEGWHVNLDAMPDLKPAGGESIPQPLPEAIQKLVDRVASEDAAEGGKAWLEIGARYQDAASFLKDFKPALSDPRPVRFAMVEETFSGGGSTFRYFTVQGDPSKGSPVPANTVGEALRYHLWQYENVGGSGFKGGFQDWWKTYAPKNGLPA